MPLLPQPQQATITVGFVLAGNGAGGGRAGTGERAGPEPGLGPGPGPGPGPDLERAEPSTLKDLLIPAWKALDS